MNLFNKFRKNEKGQGMVEYGLILALVSVVAIGALGGIGEKVNDTFDKVTSVITGEVTPDDKVPEEENLDQYLATDSDFEGTKNGEFKYIGNKEIVKIPHEIKGVKVTSYKDMFRGVDDSNVKKVISDNPNITDMSNMFFISSATSLDLSNFDTSSVIDMRWMFHNSSATSLDLSSFDTKSVTDMRHMFQGSSATTGYARTEADAENFNASSNKPSGLTFTVK